VTFGRAKAAVSRDCRSTSRASDVICPDRFPASGSGPVTRWLAKCDRCDKAAPAGAQKELPTGWMVFTSSPSRNMTLRDTHSTLCERCCTELSAFLAGSAIERLVKEVVP
jgi:hypothetical protein